jgi:serine/threonine protein kinase
VPAGRFTSFVPLGQGGMGIVYQAYDTLLAREVAFKVARPDGGTGPEGVTPPSPLTLRAADDAPARAAIDGLRARFLHEACLTSGLEHPAIVPVYDVGETDGGLPYYTMRLVPGHRTLADAIAATRDAAFGARAPLLESVARVADAVAFAHAQGVVHRDLKPSNIALGEFGEVVVLDWGLARARANSDAILSDVRGDLAAVGPRLGLRTAAGWLGTPGWVAPEAWDVRPADPERADVFALGAVLFEVLTGRLPWPADDASAFVAAVTAGPAPRADALDPSVPADLATLAARALERDPRQRLASAADVARGVRAWSQRSAADAERVLRLADATAASIVPTIPEQASRPETSTASRPR